MATALLLPLPRFVAYDPRTGAPLAGGFVRLTVPGGSTPKVSYQDEAQAIPNSDPIVLDAAGSCLLYGTGSYQITTTDSLGNQIPAYSGVVDVGGEGSVVGTTVDPDTGRNKLHNGMLAITQRGFGPFTGTATYTADRWMLLLDTDGSTVSIIPATRQPAGDEETANIMLFSVAPGAGASAYSVVCQRIEKVRRLSGKTVTVSFNAGGDNVHTIGVSIDQVFGTGGVPSANVLGAGKTVVVANYTGFDRYSLTFNVPSALNKTLGSNGDDYTQVNIWGSAGATNAARSGNVGSSSGSRYISDIQLEIGSQATAMEKRDWTEELANCQRFFQGGTIQYYGSVGSAAILLAISNTLPVPMRAAPTVVATVVLSTNASGMGVAASATSVSIAGTSVAAGGFAMQANYTLSADL